MDSILETIVQRIIETADPDKVILFGSRASGDKNPESDYDILVIKSGTYRKRTLTQKLYKNLLDIPAPVDIIIETPERLENLQNTPGLIYREALKGRVLYEREPLE